MSSTFPLRFISALALMVTLVSAGSDLRGNNNDHREEMATYRTFKWSVTVTNMVFMQPFSRFFVLSHNNSAARVFSVGGVASPALAAIAEDGNPMPLVEMFNGTRGVRSAMIAGTGPLLPGKSFKFMMETTDMHPFLSFAAMAGNTNDCFVGFNRVKPSDDIRMDSPGYDSGTETNDELCTNVPGPACSTFSKVNRTDLTDNGEGFIHVHRGIQGIGDLEADEYDWRNPMLRVQFNRMY